MVTGPTLPEGILDDELINSGSGSVGKKASG
jgi:hypothetical protein